MQFGQVHHIEYYVFDMKKSNEFYDWFMPMLSYEKVADWGDGVSWEHPNGTYLCFVQVEKENLNIKNNRQGNGLNHLAFMGGDLAFLDDLQKKLEDKKVKVLKRDGDYLCFEDPNEFALEVYAKK